MGRFDKFFENKIEKIMWKKVKNLDLFIRIVDIMYNKYVVYDYKAHYDYACFKLVFSFEDWSGFRSDKKQHIEITATYQNAKGEWLVKFQDEDFDKLCEKIRVWNNSHRVEMSDSIIRQICEETGKKKEGEDKSKKEKTLPIQLVQFREQDTVEQEDGGVTERKRDRLKAEAKEIFDDSDVLFKDLLDIVCNWIAGLFSKRKD